MARKPNTEDTSETITENTETNTGEMMTLDPAADPADHSAPGTPIPVVVPGDGTPADPQAAADATRASSVITPNAPAAPSDILPSVEEQKAEADKKAEDAKAEEAKADAEKPQDGIHPESGLDARFHMALDLAKRALSFGLINDLSKAVLLLLDIHGTPDPKASPLAVSAAKGETPTLL